MGDQGAAAGYLARLAETDGWFGRLDADLLRTVSDSQAALGVTGDLLEIGVFHGKSAIFFGFLTAGSERLHVCDPFDHLVVDASAPISESYRPPSRMNFEERYRREHGGLPSIHECLSTALVGVLEQKSFRLIHLDGGHRYDDVRHDLDLALDLLVPGGVIVFDDYRTVITPGVALTMWEAVAAGRLTVVALSASKAYCVRRGDEVAIPLQHALLADAGYQTEPYDLDDDVPALGVWVPGHGPGIDTGGDLVPPSGRHPSRSWIASTASRVLERLPPGVTSRLRSARDRAVTRRAR